MNEIVTREPSRAVARPRKGSQIEEVVATLAAAARDPAVDPNKVERLHQVLKDLRAEAALQAFNKAMNKLQGKLPLVVRNAEGDKKKRYADLEAIDLATRDPILAAGFSENYGTAESNLPDHYRVTCRVRHNEGHFEDFFVDCPISTKGAKGNDVMTPIHGFGSNMTYGRRYLKCLIFNIVLRGEDNDGQSRLRQDGMAYLTSNQIAELRREMADRGVAEADFCNWAGPLDMIPARDFDARIGMIRRKKKMERVADERPEND